MADGAFNALAWRYGELWNRSTIGRLQREAVWRRLYGLFRPGDTLLDLGCGDGEDALHFMSSGMQVHGIDSSPEMVRVACNRGVHATQLAIEELGRLKGSFDGVISNFGALNCLRTLDHIRGPVARLIRSGGYLAICLMGRFCLWESAWYLLRARYRKAFRRWSRHGATSSLGVRVYYPSIRELREALHPDFSLVQWYGVGVSIPPSYVTGLSNGLLSRLAGLDRRVEHLPLVRALSDHRLLILARNSA